MQGIPVLLCMPCPEKGKQDVDFAPPTIPLAQNEQQFPNIPHQEIPQGPTAVIMCMVKE